jgi:hypothetical protein
MTTLAVPDTIDAEIVDLTADEADQITGRIRQWVNAFPADDVKTAYLGRIWLAMDYDSWADWCDHELDGFTLPAVDRRQVVAELSDTGMSQRAIADVTGEPRRTIRDDLAQVGGNRPPVTGQDGKTYQREPITAPRERQPLPRAFEQAERELTKITQRISRLAEDDRFEGHREQLARSIRSDLHRAAYAICGVLEMMDGDDSDDEEDYCIWACGPLRRGTRRIQDAVIQTAESSRCPSIHPDA